MFNNTTTDLPVFRQQDDLIRANPMGVKQLVL